MKEKATILIVGVLLHACTTTLMAAPPVDEAKPPLTCWYNESGAQEGADVGNLAGGAMAEAVRLDPSFGVAWAYVISDWEDGSSCPDTLPGMVVEAAPVEEGKGPLTCWYNESGAQEGADVGNLAGGAMAEAVRLDPSFGVAWAYVISDWEDGSSCPDTLPGMVVEAAPVEEGKGPLTCWYNESGAQEGADVGNLAGGAMAEAVRLDPSFGVAWAYVISDWEDGSSCPDTLPGMVVEAAPVEEGKGPLTCWYNESGAQEGADVGNLAGGAMAEAVRLDPSFGVAWAYVISDWEDGSSCPDTLPGMVVEAAPVEEGKGPLTCWYNESGAQEGADVGNLAGGAMAEAVRLDPSFGVAWAYVISDWEDGSSCPDTLPGMVVEAAPVGEGKGPLTCWYNESGAQEGADVGNLAGGAMAEAVRLDPSFGVAWAYVISDWEDGSSCPDTLPGMVVEAAPVEEGKGPLTCWYNESGAQEGADVGNLAGGAMAEAVRLDPSFGVAWAYVISDWEDGSSCPDTLPGMVVEAAPVEEGKGPLTCWYNESGAQEGADVGNLAGGAMAEAVRLDPSFGVAWAYVISDWEDGSSCPDTLPGMVVEAPPVEEAKPPLTCWYDEKGASTGADVGNYAGRAMSEAVRLRQTGGEAWAYVISDWQDGSSCPKTLPRARSYD